MSAIVQTLNDWGENFLIFAWPMLWQSSLLIAIVFAFDALSARHLRAAVRYALWLAVLVKLLLPPALALPTGATWWLWPAKPALVPVMKSEVVTFDAPALPPENFVQTIPSIPPPPPPELSSAGWAILGYSTVGMALLLWLVIRWLRTAEKVRRAADSNAFEPLQSSDVSKHRRIILPLPAGEGRGEGEPFGQESLTGSWVHGATNLRNSLLEEICQLARLRRCPRLKLVDDVQSPAVYGLFRPVILLPRALAEKLSARQLRAVLLHEAIHLRRGDVWVNCAQTLLQIAYWWHPLLWLANARIRRLREEAVDDAVMLALRHDADAYAPTLLEVAKFSFHRPLAGLGLVGILESRSALRRRIERLVDFRPPRRAGLTFVSLCGIFAFSAVALPMGQGPAPTNAPSPNTPTNVLQAKMLSVDIAAFSAAVRAKTGETDPAIGFKKLAAKAGVDLSPPKALFLYNYHLQEIYVAAATKQDLDVIERLIEKLAPDKPGVNEMLEEGKQAYAAGHFDEAEAELNQALVVDPRNPAVQYYSALVSQALTNRSQMSHRPVFYLTTDSQAFDPLVNITAGQNYVLKAEPIQVSTNVFVGTLWQDSPDISTIHLDQFGPFQHAPLQVLLGKLSSKIGYLPMLVISRPLDGNKTFIDLPGMNNAMLPEVLDAIVKGANRPIQYVISDRLVLFLPDSQYANPVNSSQSPSAPGIDPVTGLPISASPPLTPVRATNALEMREFEVGTNIIVTNLGKGTGIQIIDVSAILKQLFAKKGVDLSPPKQVYFNPRSGVLFVYATKKDLDVIESVLEKIHRTSPMGQLKTRFIVLPESVFPSEGHIPAGATNGTGVLTNPDFQVLWHELGKQKGVEELDEPEVTSISGQRTEMRATVIKPMFADDVYGPLPPHHVLDVIPKGFISDPATDPYIFPPPPSTSVNSDDLVTKNFFIGNAAFDAAVREKTGEPDPLVGFKELAAKAGVDLSPPKNVARSDGMGVLHIHATTNDLKIVAGIIANLHCAPPMIHIKARFIEVPKSFFANGHNYIPAAATNGTGVLPNPDFQVLLHELEQQKDVEELAEPEVTTITGRQTIMRATITQPAITDYAVVAEPTNRAVNVVPQVRSIETGPIMYVVPFGLADGYTLSLGVTALDTQFFGYAKASDLPPRPAKDFFGDTIWKSNPPPLLDPWSDKISLPIVLPAIQGNLASVQKTLYDGQTLVLFPTPEPNYLGDESDKKLQERVAEYIRKVEENEGNKVLLVLVTATLIDAAGNRLHSNDEMAFAQNQVPPHWPPAQSPYPSQSTAPIPFR